MLSSKHDSNQAINASFIPKTLEKQCRRAQAFTLIGTMHVCNEKCVDRIEDRKTLTYTSAHGLPKAQSWVEGWPHVAAEMNQVKLNRYTNLKNRHPSVPTESSLTFLCIATQQSS
jgi:hypothetical protein